MEWELSLCPPLRGAGEATGTAGPGKGLINNKPVGAETLGCLGLTRGISESSFQPLGCSGLCKRQLDKPSLILCGQFCLLFIFVVPKPDLSDGEIVLCKVGEINIAGACCAQRTPPGSAQGCAAELHPGR